MKKILFYIGLAAMAVLMCSCTGADEKGTETVPEAGESSVIQNTEESTSAPAETVEVIFVFEDRYYTVECEIGKTPEVPDFEKTYESRGNKITFEGWMTEIVPAKKSDAVGGKIYYVAKVKKEKMSYTVTFEADGKIISTQSVEYGKTAVTPAETPVKTGMKNFLWIDADQEIHGDTVIHGFFFNSDATAMKLALEAEPLYYAGDYNDNRGNALEAASAMVYLLTEGVKESDPDGIIPAKILAHLRNLISGGKEPFFDAEPYWNYPILCAAIDLCKNTPSVWNELTGEEKEKLDCIMEAFLYICSFCTDDDNDYGTGPRLRGNYRKNWNPNYRLANVPQILFLKDYFGSSETVNRMLANFDYDAMIAKFKEYGFTNAYSSWTTKGLKRDDGTLTIGARELLSEGGQVYIMEDGKISPKGIGVGVKAGGSYSYLGHGLDDTDGIMKELLEYCYSGGKVTNGLTVDGQKYAYILNGSDSPVLGLEGMMLEFNTTDGNGPRSSCSYTSHDFLMVVSCLTAAEKLGIFDLEKYPELYKKVLVGNLDTVYKLDVGYRSYSLGKGYSSYAADRGNGYLIWSAYFKGLGLSVN